MLKLELMNVCFIENTRPSFNHFHGFQLLGLTLLFTKTTSVICTKRLDLLYLRTSSNRLIIYAKGFLRLASNALKFAYASKTSLFDGP